MTPFSTRISEHWPQNALEYVYVCPVCKSSERTMLHEDLEDNVFFCAPGKWMLFGCKGCSSAYLDPRPSIDYMSLAYTTYYTHQSFEDRDIKKIRLLRKVSRFLKSSALDSYRQYVYSTNSSATSYIVGAFICCIFPIRKMYERKFRNLNSSLTERGKLLDVGSGRGDFLLIARDAGWEVHGVDMDPLAVASGRAKGLEIRTGSIDEFTDCIEGFDVITISHVIEHVYDPIKLLSDAFMLLKPGGRIWIETPNIESFGYSKYGKFWRGLEAPRHLTIFNYASLKSALENVGFTSLVEKPYWNYYYVSKKSHVIASGLDPYRMGQLPVSQSIKIMVNGLISRVLTLKPYKHTEFITLIGTKPKLDGMEIK